MLQMGHLLNQTTWLQTTNQRAAEILRLVTFGEVERSKGVRKCDQVQSFPRSPKTKHPPDGCFVPIARFFRVEFGWINVKQILQSLYIPVFVLLAFVTESGFKGTFRVLFPMLFTHPEAAHSP